MFMSLYEFLIEPLGLPIEWYWEYLILFIINEIAYRIAYDKVGDMYDAGMSGKDAGSFFHCIIRTFCFGVMWAIAYGVIWLCKWLFANWILVVSIVGAIFITIGLIIIITKIIKNKKKREISPNETDEK